MTDMEGDMGELPLTAEEEAKVPTLDAERERHERETRALIAELGTQLRRARSARRRSNCRRRAGRGTTSRALATSSPAPEGLDVDRLEQLGLSAEQTAILRDHLASRQQTFAEFLGDVLMEYGLGRATGKEYPPPVARLAEAGR